MKLKYGQQISIDEIDKEKIDLFILAGNHEKRIYSAYDTIIKNNTIDKAISFCYTKIIEVETRKINCFPIKSNTDICNLLDKEIGNNNGIIKLVIDYSCMTKSWYYTIIQYLTEREHNLTSAQIYFIYTPSKYSNPISPKANKEIAPLPGKVRVPTNKPKALIVCLGYEQNKAEGIIDHLDPKASYIFYSKPALDVGFVKKLEENNKKILKDPNRNNETIITFPFNDLLNLEQELTALYFKLRDKYSIIIAPLGPKPFTLVSMILSIKFKDIDIWRVGSGSDINRYKREPILNSFIINKIVFE